MIWVGIGSVIGSLLRFALGEIFPGNGAGVLLANLLGVAIATHAVVYCEKRGTLDLKHFLIPGFCGGLTTFSSLMLITEQRGLFYLFGTLVASFAIAITLIPVARGVFSE